MTTTPTTHQQQMAERVLNVLTKLRLGRIEDEDIEINMNPDDVKELNQSKLWGKRITEAYWVQRGHPEVVATIIA